MKFGHIAVGGTFDLFHKGHKDFLRGAFAQAKRVSVGITSDDMAATLGKTTFYSYEERTRNIREFLQKSHFNAPWEILKINDIFGTTISDPTIDAVCVTEDTIGGALKINEARAKLNMKAAKILQLPLTRASDGNLISSTRITAGEINQEGLNYSKHLLSFSVSKLTEKLRRELAKPQGKLYSNLEMLMKHNTLDPAKLISVGDQTTYNLVSKNISPHLAIVDFKVERKRVFKDLAELGFSNRQRHIDTSNPAGEITIDLVNKLCEVFGQQIQEIVVVVDGEEDLSVLPAALLSPLGYKILYGQRRKGLVIVDVNPQTKDRFLAMYNSFEKVS